MINKLVQNMSYSYVLRTLFNNFHNGSLKIKILWKNFKINLIQTTKM